MHTSENVSTQLLLIDKDLIARKALARRLREAGYRVEEAATGPMAEQLVSREHFDMVLLDQYLGETTGIELLSRLGNRRVTAAMIDILSETPRGTTLMPFPESFGEAASA